MHPSLEEDGRPRRCRRRAQGEADQRAEPTRKSGVATSFPDVIPLQPPRPARPPACRPWQASAGPEAATTVRFPLTRRTSADRLRLGDRRLRVGLVPERGGATQTLRDAQLLHGCGKLSDRRLKQQADLARSLLQDPAVLIIHRPANDQEHRHGRDDQRYQDGDGQKTPRSTTANHAPAASEVVHSLPPLSSSDAADQPPEPVALPYTGDSRIRPRSKVS